MWSFNELILFIFISLVNAVTLCLLVLFLQIKGYKYGLPDNPYLCNLIG